jgi:ferredoxin-nitrite reductase
MNKIEEYKREKDGLDVLEDVPRFAREGWESINDGDRERLKWLGVFFRRQTPGHFMMRVRVPNGKSTSAQFRAIAEIGRDFGKGFVDLTTRQQVQLRWFAIDQVQPIWDRLEEVGLVSLQTGMDNIRNVVGCPVAGLTANELFDASPVVQQYTDIFLRNKAYTNLPRKFNVTITGCRENCTHGRTQDISLTPAVQILNGEEIKGFNVAVGGKQGSGGYRPASPLNIFVPPEEAAELCSHITLIFSDHGPREARNKARLSFLIDHWGVDKFCQELEKRVSHPLLPGGVEASQDCQTDHIGVFPQKQAGLNYIGMVVPVGRIDTEQLLDVARLADVYGNGEIRLTTQQNLIIPNVPDAKISALRAEPPLAELRCDPSEAMRGTVSCTGIDYCHFALIDTKELAVKTARYLEERLGQIEPITIHWSGCPNACGNHAVADIGLLGRKARVNGQIIDAVDIFLGDRLASRAAASGERLENIPCEELPRVLERLISAPAALTV